MSVSLGFHSYFWAGTKFYDLLAGAENIESSYFLTKSKALDAFPMLKQNNLFGALVYYGKFDCHVIRIAALKIVKMASIMILG